MINYLKATHTRALIYSLGLQIVALLLCELKLGDFAGFGRVLNLIGMLILTPMIFTPLVISDAGISANALEVLSWVVQFGLWFAVFDAVLFWRSQWDYKSK